MIKIIPDREGFLTQWDSNRKVRITGLDSIGDTEVHFAPPNDTAGAYVVLPTVEDGVTVATIPNILLTIPGRIDVFVYRDDHTCVRGVLVVAPREKPEDYVYTETEVLNYRTLADEIGDVSQLETQAKSLVGAVNETVKRAPQWKKIREFTLPDDPATDTSDISYTMSTSSDLTGKISVVSFTTTDDGNAFDVQDILLVANWGSVRGGNYFGMADQNGSLGYGNILANALSGSALKKYAYLSVRLGDYRYAFRAEDSNWMNNASGVYLKPNAKDDLHITTIKIGTFMDQAMLPGSSFIVYGR